MTTGRTRVLYVDDDAGLRRLVQRGLQTHGFDVEVAPDGQAGLDALVRTDFDIVALDQYMPVLDGMETLAHIRALDDPPPVIFVTGAQESKLAVAALKAGAADYVIKDVQGEFIAMLAAAADNALQSTALRRAKEAAEAEVRAARDRFEALATERAMLLREVNHRVGNSLQLIAALLQLQASTNPSQDIKAALANATSRVMAVAQVHKRLYTSDDVQSVAVDQYLEALVEDLRGAADEGQRAFLTLDTEPLQIDPDRAVALGVIVNELVINALKYAYPNGSGPIRITLGHDERGRCRLCVEDDGVGDLGVKTAKSTGLGQQIVNAMAVKLDAEVRRDKIQRGTRVIVSFDPQGHARIPPVPN